MGNILLLFLVLFPMLLSAWVFPLRRRDRRYRNWLIQIIPAVELAAALLLLLWPGAALELPGVFGFGLRLQAGSLGSLHALVTPSCGRPPASTAPATLPPPRAAIVSTFSGC